MNEWMNEWMNEIMNDIAQTVIDSELSVRSSYNWGAKWITVTGYKLLEAITGNSNRAT